MHHLASIPSITQNRKRMTTRYLPWGAVGLLCGHLPTAIASPIVISRLGAGTGAVSSRDLNIDCSDVNSVCLADYVNGSPIALTAIAGDAYSRFLYWGAGFCHGASNPCITEADGQPHAVAAYFSGAMLAAGRYYSLALTKDGNVWAWGKNDAGQLGVGDVAPHTGAVQVKYDKEGTPLKEIQYVAAGVQHAVALDNGGVLAWGENQYGELGDSTTYSRSRAVKTVDISGISLISAGQAHTIALTEQGVVWTWGSNSVGQLGDETNNFRDAPAEVPSLTNIIAVAAGEKHSLALKHDGTVWAWGANQDAQLGDNTTQSRSKPQPVAKLEGIVAIAAGGSHNLALQSDGMLWAWGQNSSGQLGEGTQIPRLIPVPVKNIKSGEVTRIAAGQMHSVVLKRDGTVWAWGNNASGQLGLGESADKFDAPMMVPNLVDVKAIAAGGEHTLALLKDGTVWAWGSNADGQLGNSTVGKRTQTPVQVMNMNLYGLVPPVAYTLTVKKTGTGTVSGGGKFAAGANVTLKATPATDAIFSGWSPSPCAYAFTMPAKSLTCTATFIKKEAIKYTVTATAGAGGVITPATRTVEKGKTTTFTVKPNSTDVVNTVTGCKC